MLGRLLGVFLPLRSVLGSAWEGAGSSAIGKCAEGVVREVRGNFFIASSGGMVGRLAARGVVAALGLLVAACQSPAGRHGQAAAVPPARIIITSGNLTFSSPAGAAARDGSIHTSALHVLVDRRPDLGIEVSVTGGRLVRVSAVNGAGRAVAGILGAGGAGWRADWALTPGQAYHVTATAVNPRGRAAAITGSFRTLT